MTFAKKFLFSSLLIIIYLFRLFRLPDYRIPEDKEVQLIGRITSQPDFSGSYQIIKMGRITLKTHRYPGYSYGDFIKVTGRFRRQVLNPFLTRYYSPFPSIQMAEEVSDGGDFLSFRRFLIKTRGLIEERVSSLLPEPEASLLLGIVLGSKREMPKEFLQKLQKTGTTHLIVASGQNISLVSGYLFGAFSLIVSRRPAVIFSLTGIILYVLMVGAEPPAVRAGLMAAAAYFAQIFGREGEVVKSWLLAGVIILLVSPLALFDTGFQLSFSASAGLIIIYPQLKTKLKYDSGEGKNLPVFPAILFEAFLTTLSAQLATLPIILANFGRFSLLSPLVNTLVLPVVPIIMIFGFFSIAAGFLSAGLAKLAGLTIWPFLHWFVGVVNFFASGSWMNWEIDQLPLGLAVGYYLLLGGFLLMCSRRKAGINS